jgi:hypothetical protein
MIILRGLQTAGKLPEAGFNRIGDGDGVFKAIDFKNFFYVSI